MHSNISNIPIPAEHSNIRTDIFSLTVLELQFFNVSAITILHLWIHALDFLLKIASHLICGHLKYNETMDIKDDCERALREIQTVDIIDVS